MQERLYVMTVIGAVFLLYGLYRVVTAAFLNSFEEGLLCLCLPPYIVYFAFRRYGLGDKHMVWCSLVVGLITCLVCALKSG